MTAAIYDFVAKERSDGLHLFVRAYSAPFLALGFLLGIVGVIAMCFGIIPIALGRDGSVLGVGVAMVLLGLLIGSRRFVRRLIITPSTLIVGRRPYALDDVRSIRVDESGASSTGTVYLMSPAVALLGQLGQYLNNMITIEYGTRRAVILGGQTRETVGAVRSVVLGYLRSHGRQYGRADDNDVADYRQAVARGQHQNLKYEPVAVLSSWKRVAGAALIIGFLSMLPGLGSMVNVIAYPLVYFMIDTFGQEWLLRSGFLGEFLANSLSFFIVIYALIGLIRLADAGSAARDLDHDSRDGLPVDKDRPMPVTNRWADILFPPSLKYAVIGSLLIGFSLLTWVSLGVGFNGNAFHFAVAGLALSLVIFVVIYVLIVSIRAYRKATYMP